MRPLCLITLLSVLLFPPSISAADLHTDLREALAAARPGEEIPVIVTFRGEADLRPFKAQVKAARRTGVAKALRARAEESQQEVRTLLEGRGKKFDRLWIVNGLALSATPELISLLSARPEVAAIELDAVLEVPEVVPSQVAGVEDNIHAVGATDLWNRGFRGQGVTIAILDSGVDIDHPDLAPRWRGGTNSWFDPYLGTPTPSDPDGHGTLVAGIVVGGSFGGTAIGVAPESRWIAAKIFDDAGRAFNSRIILSMQWALDPNRDGLGDDAPDLVNASWGFDVANECIAGNAELGAPAGSVRQAVQALKGAGIGVVTASGNFGSGGAPSSISPGNYPESLAVGAVGPDLLLADFSGRGPSACDDSVYPELVAPGVGILTSNLSDPGSPPQYARVDGTSFSAPHVTGVMALLLNAFPTLSITDLETIVKTSATDLGAAGADNGYGSGMVSATAAFNLLSGVPDLAVHDPAPPESDLLLDFGHIPPGTLADRTVTLRNAGSGVLNIAGLGTVPSPFALIADLCSNRSLTAGQACTLTLRFAPPALSPPAFSAALPIASNDPGQGTLTVQLAGTGNTPPPAPQPVAPAGGATGVAVPTILQWTQAADAEGDAITHFIFLSTNPSFSDTVPQQVAGGGGRIALLAGAGGLLAFSLAALARRRRWRPAVVLVAAALAILAACNGGGDSSSAPPAGPVLSFTVTDLAPGTTYFWKVVSQDSRGGESEGSVQHFTTRP